MKKLNRVILGAATAAATIAPIAAIVACGNQNIGDIWAYSHRDIHKYEETPDGNSPFYGYDYKFIPYSQYIDTTSVGDALKTSSIINFFRRDKMGNDTFKKVISTKDGHKVTSISASPNRTTKLSFEAVGSVAVTSKATGAEVVTVFDNDSFGIASQDDKSINGTKFKQLLNAGGITKMAFTLSDKMANSFWVKNNSGKKKAPITMEDAWTSIQYDFYNNVKYFGEHLVGGNIKTDASKKSQLYDYYNTKSRAKSPVFKEAEPKDADPTLLRYENINGLLKGQFSNKSKLISGNTLTLSFNNKMSIAKQKYKVLSFWNDLFIHHGGLGLRSTQNIKNIVEKHPIPNSLASQLFNGSELNDFKASPLYKSGILSSYETPWDEFEIGGKYYFSTNEAKKIAVRINPYYNAYIGKFDNTKKTFSNSNSSNAVKWIDQKNSKGEITVVRSFTKHYLTKSPLSEHIKLQAYKQGFNTEYKEPSDLSKHEYVESLTNPDKFGIHFATGYTSGAVIGDYNFWQILPLFGRSTEKSKNKPENVYFNNAYSKAMWGHTLKELSERKDNLGDAMISAVAGHGFQFRETIMASLNTFGLLKEQMGHVNDWSSQFAPELEIKGRDHPGQTFLPAHPNVFKGSVTDKLLLKGISSKYIVSIDNSGKIKAEQITWDQYKKQYVKADGEAIEKLSAPKAQFDKLKTSMKASLDSAGISAGEKVSFEIPFGRHSLSSKKMKQKIDSMIDIINKLDPRLNAVAQMRPDGHGSATVVAHKTTDESFTIEKNAKDHPFISRLLAADKGYSIASINVASKYTTPTTSSAMYDHFGRLQSGILSATSYFSSAEGHTAIAGGIMEPYGEIADEIKKSFNKYIMTADTVLNGEPGITQNVINEIKATKFEEIIKSHSQDLADFDYNGMLGPKSTQSQMIANLRKDINGTHDDGTGKQITWKAVYKPVMDFVSTWVDNIKYEMNIFLSAKTLEEQLKIYRAFRLVEPGYIQKGPLGDRSVPAMSLEKNWITQPADEYANSYLSYWRVDEERG